MSKNFRQFYLTRNEVMVYLNISEWKIKKIISEDKLNPDLVVNATIKPYKCYLYHIFKVIKLKKALKEEGYIYKNA